jgi:toxin ParE1/3/4
VAGPTADIVDAHQRRPGRNELIALGLREFRQVFFKPYRIICRIIETNLYILLLADGHRDMQTLLQRCLLQG